MGLTRTKLCFVLFCLALSSFMTTCGASVSRKLPPICESKCRKSIHSTETEKYCNQHQGLQLEHRCCMNSSTSAILGIDLQQCDQTIEKFASGIANLSHLVIISLEGNPIKKVKGIDFNNNTQIEYLSLPPNTLCPGRNYSWETEEYLSNHTVCINELDPCSPPRNYTCPHNSYCVQAGVNMTDCFCDKGYHGYKCLKQGEFPFLQYGLGISIPSAIMCVFLWVTQRRYVKTTPKDT